MTESPMTNEQIQSADKEMWMKLLKCECQAKIIVLNYKFQYHAT